MQLLKKSKRVEVTKCTSREPSNLLTVIAAQKTKRMSTAKEPL